MESYIIDESVVLGKDCRIMPFAVVKGKSVIGDNSIIGSFSEIIDSKIGNNCNVSASRVVNSNIGEGSVVSLSCLVDSTLEAFTLAGPYCDIRDSSIGMKCRLLSSTTVNSKICAGSTVGPYAHIREGSIVGERSRVGNFVEIKKSSLGEGVKSAHLAYIGDAEIGEGTNIGCGVVFVNYDGKVKHRTKIGKRCFVGSSVNLIAPIELGDDSFVACGTTLTASIPAGSFAIGRSRPYVRKRT